MPPNSRSYSVKLNSRTAWLKRLVLNGWGCSRAITVIDVVAAEIEWALSGSSSNIEPRIGGSDGHR